MTYRYLQQEEFDSALALCLAVFDEAVASYNPPAGRDSFARFIGSSQLRQAFMSGEMKMAGCFDGSTLIGVIGVKGLKAQPHISLLFVSQQYAKCGIGKRLIDFALGNKRNVTVNASINAEGFYQSCGFQRTAGLVFEDGLRTIPMQRKSNFRVAKAVSVSLSAILPLYVNAVILLLQRIYPFGEKSFLIYDLKSQYIDFYNAFAKLFSGELLYSFSRTLGGDNFTLNAYYLFSPYNLILLFFDKSSMADGALLLFVLKTMSAGLSFALCAVYSRLIKSRSEVFYICLPAFAAAYALCGFAASYSLNIFWLDALIILPVLSLAIEWACKGKARPFVLVLALALVINFYFGYMLLIFSLTAYPVYSKLLGKAFTRGDFTACLKYISTSLLLSGVVTVPVFFGLMATKLSQSSPLFKIFKNISFADTVAVFELFFIVAAICFVLISIIRPKAVKSERVISKKVKDILKVAFIVLAALLAIAEHDKLISLFHQLFAFYNNVEEPPVFSTITVVVLFVTIPFTKGVLKRCRFWFFALPVFWLITLLAEPLYLLVHMGQQPLSYPGRQAFMFSFLVLFLVLSMLEKLNTELTKRKIKPLIVLLPLLMITEVIINTQSAFTVNEKAYYGYVKREDYIGFIEQTESSIDRLGSDEFFRIEKTFNRSLNDAYTFGTSGISHYSSMYENEVINTFNLMGLSASAYWVQYSGSTPVTDMLFGIRYVLDDKQKSYQKDYYSKAFSQNGITVYQNPYALQIAYVAKHNLYDLNADTINPFALQNKFVAAITDTDKLPFEEISDFSTEETIYRLEDNPDIKVTKYKIKAENDGGLFLSLKYITATLKLSVGSEFISDFPKANGSGTVYLGKISAGEDVTVTIESDANAVIPKENTFFAILNTDTLANIYNSFNNGVELKQVSPGKIVGRAEGEMVFVSLPYSIGWKAYAGGKSISTFNAGSGFLGVHLPDGGDFELIYTPPGLWTGVFISSCGVLALFILYKTKKGA